MLFANRPTGKVELITRDGVAIDITDEQRPELKATVHFLIKSVMLGVPYFIILKMVLDYLVTIL